MVQSFMTGAQQYSQTTVCSTLWKSNVSSIVSHLERREVWSETSFHLREVKMQERQCFVQMQSLKSILLGTPPVVWWLRIHLAIQGSILGRETKILGAVHTPEPVGHNERSHTPHNEDPTQRNELIFKNLLRKAYC